MNNISYERRSVEDILDWLKGKAVELSNGRWTDFSSGDIGSVFLGLMAYLADMNNFQIDKTASELYLDTAQERASIISLLKLIGYEPRHYESAYTQIAMATTSDITGHVIPRYSTFTNDSGTIIYTSLEDIPITKGVGYGLVYEGERVAVNYTSNQITTDGKIYLPDYKIGMNTIQLFISGIGNGDGEVKKCKDVRFIAGEFQFSAHVDEFARVYIQLPSYWTDLITSTSSITVSYLLTQGEAGRIGANILTEAGSGLGLMSNYLITNPYKSSGGYFPETADELKINGPRQARTMETIITKNDMRDLVLNLPNIASIKCGDYNDDWTGYVQPSPPTGGYINDAYKALVLATPTNTSEISLYEDVYTFQEVGRIHDGETCTLSDGTVVTYTTDERTLNKEKYQIDDSHKDSNGYRIILEYLLYKEHQPTNTLKEMMAYIDERRLASLYITYEDPKRLVPNILLYVYTEENDLRKDTIAEDIKGFMKSVYNREYCSIGKSLHGSVIGRDLHLAFPAIKYIEVNPPQYKLDVDPDQYIDMFYAKFKIYVNDVLYLDEWTAN